MNAKRLRTMATALLCGVLTAVFALPIGAAAPADAPYRGYEYNDYKESAAAPVGYIQTAFFDSADFGLQDLPLDNPQDMCFAGNHVYVLDGANSRILELDAELNWIKTYDAFHNEAGEPVTFADAQGFAVGEDGRFYVADTEGLRILVFRRDGTLELEIGRPDEALVGEDLPFRVVQVRVNSRGEILAIADSINLGIFVFSPEGEFQKFEGSNPIYKTSDVLLSFFLRRFYSEEQRKNMIKSTPLRVLDFCLDKEDYIYTVSFNDQAIDQSDMVRQLNYRGTNILQADKGFGDFETPSDTWEVTRFIGVDVDDDGFLYLLDGTRGRVFQYSKQGYLVSLFGGYGDQKGTFGDPVCLRAVGDKIYVLDGKKNGIHVFSPTEYVTKFRTALAALDERELDKSEQLWNDLLKMNTNSLYPYYGLGMIYDARGDYTRAMENYKLAGAQEEYSQSFREYRKLWIGRNYLFVILAVILIVAAVAAASRVIRRRLAAAHGETYSPMEQKWLFPLHTLFHPVDGFEQFKFRRALPSWRLASGIVLLWYILASVSWYGTGFSFSNARPNDFNPLATLVSTAGIFLLFVLSNWCLCTLFNGKGTMKEIFVTCAYALVPYILSIGLNLLLTNILTADEGSFVEIVTIIGVLWSAALLLGGLYGIHQFTFGKSVLSIIATILGMGVIMLLLVLFYTLIGQATGFIRSVMMELSLR